MLVKIFHMGARLLDYQQLLISGCFTVDSPANLFDGERLAQSFDCLAYPAEDILLRRCDLCREIGDHVVVSIQHKTRILRPMLEACQRFEIVVESTVGID